MPIPRSGKLKVIKARTHRGKCGICHKPIWPNQKYVKCIGGTNTREGYNAHWDCYNPSKS